MGISTSYTEVSAEKGRGPWVHVLPDLHFPRYATIDVRDDPRSAVDVTLRLVFDVVACRYVVDNMEVYRRDRHGQIDGTALRTIPVQEYMRSLDWTARIDGTEDTLPNPLPDDLVKEIKASGPSDVASLRWLARVYVAAHALSQPPGRTVQESLQMPAPTASVWIRRARDRGLIPDTFDQDDGWMSEEDFELGKSALRDG